MARIESQAKAGFYPTPDSVCDLLQTKITFEDGARIFDPCCGAGLTLSRLATNTTTTYGIELNHERSSEARSRLRGVKFDEVGRRKRITTRPVKALDRNVKLNQTLWFLTEKMRELKSGFSVEEKQFSNAAAL